MLLLDDGMVVVESSIWKIFGLPPGPFGASPSTSIEISPTGMVCGS
jgi:hypothetical protein